MRLIDADNIVVYIGGRINGKTIFADMVKKILDQQPTVEAEPVRHGTWKKVVPSRWGSLFECSECGEKTTESVMGKPRYEYCPMCGAKMEEYELARKRTDTETD